MTATTSRTGHALGSIGALVVLFAAIPLGLLAASRARFGSPNPFHDIAPPWQWSGRDLADAAAEPLRDDAVVNLLVRGSIGVIWLALVVIAITTIVEVIHMMRHRGVPMPRVRGLGFAQPVARFVAAGLIVLLPASSMTSTATALTGDANTASRASIAHTLGNRTQDNAVSAAADTMPSEPDRTHRDQGIDSSVEASRTDRAADISTYVVQQGDSVWEIAASRSDGNTERTMEIAEAILEANLGHTMDDGQRFSNPALIQPGWTLVMPAGAGGSVSSASPQPAASDAIHPDAVAMPDQVDPVDGQSDPEAAAIDVDDHVVHMVVEGDTLSSIAGEHLGDAQEWPIVFDANDGIEMDDGRTFEDPNLIVPGWELEIPTGADELVPADSTGTQPASPTSESTSVATPTEPAAEETATDDDQAIGPGSSDTEELPAGSSSADGTPAESEPEAIDADAEPDEVEHDAIEVTDEATVDEHDDARATDDGPPTHPDDHDVADESSMDDALAPSNTINEVADAETQPPVIVADTPVATSPISVPSTTTTTSIPAAIDPGESAPPSSDAPESPAAPSPIRLEHAALLAAGILSLVGVRRIRRLRAAMPRARVPVPPPEIAATERLLRTIEPGEGAARLDIALRAAAHQLAETGAGIGTVRLATDGHVILRLTEAGRLDAPWVGMGADWELPASVPIELLAEEARNTGAPCLALAQVGVDNMGRSVLVDLEAAGLTTIEARASQADDVVRAIATGIASSLHSEVAHLVTASLDPACLLDHPNAHHRRSVDAAVDIALALAGSTITNERPTFDLRALRTGGEMWEPAIVLFESDDRAAERLTVESLPPARHGLALVCPVEPGQLRDSGVRIEAHADRWELIGFGERTEIVPLGVTATELGEITALLDDADAPVDAVDENVADALAEPVDEPFEVLPHDIVVGLVGGVEVRSRSGELGTFERSKTVELIAWLATHRERATRTAARTALWELDVRDATFANVVSEARRSLGRLVPTQDGEEWLARTLNESLPLHERVVTDADLVEQRLEHARLAAPSHAIDVLRPAVELIRDMPFAGTSYLWPDADGLTSNLVLLATTVTAELAAHALSIGDTEMVFWATGHGLRVLSGHEELIALRMRAHARAGDLAGVRQEWESYERVIVADSWSDGEPAPKLLDLRRELLSANA